VFICFMASLSLSLFLSLLSLSLSLSFSLFFFTLPSVHISEDWLAYNVRKHIEKSFPSVKFSIRQLMADEVVMKMVEKHLRTLPNEEEPSVAFGSTCRDVARRRKVVMSVVTHLVSGSSTVTECCWRW